MIDTGGIAASHYYALQDVKTPGTQQYTATATRSALAFAITKLRQKLTALATTAATHSVVPEPGTMARPERTNTTNSNSKVSHDCSHTC